MQGVNKVIIVGNLGRKPDLRQTQSGAAVANFSVAVSEKFKDRNGQYKDRTEWVSVVAWQKLAELADTYLDKGSKVYLEGRLSTRSWDDRDGQKHKVTEVIATSIVFLDSRTQNGSNGDSNNNYDNSIPPPIQDDDLPF